MTAHIKELPVDLLEYGPEQVPYQRALDDAKFFRMAGEFDLSLVGVPEVSLRTNGAMIVIDGQHRCSAALLANVKTLSCKVHQGMSYQEEVQLYRKLNAQRRRLEPIDDFKAALEEGDPEDTAINKLVENEGFQIRKGGGAHNIGAIRELRKVYRRDAAALTETLRLCSETLTSQMSTGEVLSGPLLAGVHVVISVHDGIDRKRLAKVLKAHPPMWWTSQSNTASTADKRYARIATVIIREYNNRLRTSGNRLPHLEF